jgi:tetratricopeptide (TPR) repeat protein
VPARQEQHHGYCRRARDDAHGRAGQHDSRADAGAGQNPQHERRQPKGESFSTIRGVAAPIGVGQDLGPERSECHRQQDEQKVSELSTGREGSSKGSMDRREGSRDRDLEAARRDGCGGERPAPEPGPQEVRRGRQQGGTTDQLKHNGGCRIRGQRDTRRGSLLAQKAKQLSGFVVNYKVHGSNLLERRFGQWDELQDTEQRQRQDRPDGQNERTQGAERRTGAEGQGTDGKADSRNQESADRCRGPGDRGRHAGALEPRSDENEREKHEKRDPIPEVGIGRDERLARQRGPALSKLHGLILLALLAFGRPGLGFGASAAPVDFNQARLESGKYLYDEKRYLEAIDQFRIAAFGFLNRPDWLSASLARLALAQTAASRPDDADATLARFVELQRRFPAYPPPGLEAERQAEFRALLLKRVQEATLLSVPSLAVLVESEEQKIARLAPAERRKALEAAARRDPSSVVWRVAVARDAAERGDWKESERWASMAIAIQPNNADALALRARARVARGELPQARADLNALPSAELAKRPELYADVFVTGVDAGDWTVAADVQPRIPANLATRPDVVKAQQKFAAERQRQAALSPPRSAAGATASTLAPAPPAPAPPNPAAMSNAALVQSRQLVQAGRAAEAQAALAEALKADPDNRELRLALLEAACLSRSYRDGAVQVPLVAPFGETEAPSMFYAAVVLYETGKEDEARGYLRRAMPRVTGPLVDEYSRKILGP